MKKILALLTVVIFGTSLAQANVYSETNKALNKVETTMNRVDNNIQTARNTTTKENMKSTAKTETKKKTDSFWDRIFGK